MYDYRWVQTLDSLSSFFWGLVPDINLAGLAYIILASTRDFIGIMFAAALVLGIVVSLFVNLGGGEDV